MSTFISKVQEYS